MLAADRVAYVLVVGRAGQTIPTGVFDKEFENRMYAVFRVDSEREVGDSE